MLFSGCTLSPLLLTLVLNPQVESTQPQCDAHVLTAVIDSMETHQSSALVQAHGCAVLAAAVGIDTPMHIRVAAAVAATSSFTNNTHVQIREMALHTLVCVSAGADPLQLELALTPALPAASQLVCEATDAGHAVHLVDDAMQLLANLCQVPRQERLSSLGSSLVLGVLQVMSRLGGPRSPSWHNGITLIRSLSELGAEWCRRIVNAGGMGLLQDVARGPDDASSGQAALAVATILNSVPLAGRGVPAGSWRQEVLGHKQLAQQASHPAAKSLEGANAEEMMDELFEEFLMHILLPRIM